jgi:quinol monooxygenase YgiN
MAGTSVKDITPTEILGIGRFKLHEGKLEEFKRLSEQAIELVRSVDAGTLQYDIYFNDDQYECIIIERYKDSSALIEHAAHVGHLMGAIFATGQVSSELLGEPNKELRTMMADGEVRRFALFLSAYARRPS